VSADELNTIKVDADGFLSLQLQVMQGPLEHLCFDDPEIFAGLSDETIMLWRGLDGMDAHSAM
jgi:hypothetical protein